jgi:hypothetical protein
MAKCDLQPGLHQISPLSLSLLLTHISSNAFDRRQPDHTVRTLAMPRKLPSPYLSLYQHGKIRTPKLRASNKPEQTKPPHPKQHSSESMQQKSNPKDSPILEVSNREGRLPQLVSDTRPHARTHEPKYTPTRQTPSRQNPRRCARAASAAPASFETLDRSWS